MKSLGLGMIWSLSLFSILSFCMMMYWGYHGVEYTYPKHWHYYPKECSLLCADKKCIHPVHYPEAYHNLVVPQIRLLKQTGYYKLANLLVYFIFLPLFYVLSFCIIFKSWIKKQSWLITGFIGIVSLLPIVGILDAFFTPWGRLYLYWGSTLWCIDIANTLKVSLLDVYTGIFGILIPGSIIFLLFFCVYKQIYDPQKL